MNTQTLKKVIVTGVSSFIGCHLAKSFADRGWRVLAITSQNTSHYQGIQKKRFDFVRNQVEFFNLDLTELAQVKDFLVEHGQGAVWIHHAGYAKNYGSLDYDMNEGHRINVAPLYDLYPLFQQCGIEGVIVTGSSAEYSNSDQACSENDFCEPTMPYGLSKLTESLAALQLSKRYQVPTSVARVFIPYGPFDVEGKLMQYVAEQLSQKKAVDLSPCEQSRDFIHVDDLALGYVKIAESIGKNQQEIYNICSGEAVLLKNLLLKMTQILNVSEDLLHFGAKPMRAGEPMMSYGSNQKFGARFGWTPKSLEDGLRSYLISLGILK